MFKSKFLILAFLLFLVWVGAFVVLHVAGFMLRALLVLALVFLVAHFLSKKKKA